MKHIALMVVVILVFTGCGSPDIPLAFSEASSEKSFESQMAGQIGGFSYGDNVAWPDYLPEDIPPLSANITTVFADQYTIRIFFSDMPENEFETYLLLLEKRGFSLQYIVYELEGMPTEKAEERLEQGKYDAVRITKGSYSMNIEYGNGQGTFDIDVEGLPEGTVIGGPKWPESLEGILEAPEDCILESVIPTEDAEIQITCKSENALLLQDYMAKLSLQGFVEGQRSKNQNNEIIETSFTKGNVLIELTNYRPGEMGISIQTDAVIEEVFGKSVNGGWPQGLPASLPVFADRQIQTSFVLNDKTVKIMIQQKDETDIQTYQDLLIQNGFVAQDPDKMIFLGAYCRVTIETYMNADFFSILVEIM